jgi:hypothetical protein
MVNKTAGVTPFHGAHTAINTAKQAKACLFRIVDSDFLFAAATVDGGMLSAGNAMVGEDDTSWCLAHRLHLVVNHSIQDTISTDVATVHQLVVGLRASIHLREELIRRQSVDVPHPLQLVSSVPTRWVSTYDEIDRVIVLCK